MFKKKLKIEIFIKLMRHSAIINILDDLIETTIKINKKLYQLQMITRLLKFNGYY